MDEKKVREAIELIKQEIQTLEDLGEVVSIIEEKKKKHIELYNTVIEALEKQLPEKVKMRTEYRDLNDELICYKGFCPSCGNVVDSYRNKSCNHCSQLLDWSEE